MAVVVNQAAGGTGSPYALPQRVTTIGTTTLVPGPGALLGWVCTASNGGTIQVLDSGSSVFGPVPVVAGQAVAGLNCSVSQSLQVTTAGTSIDITFFYYPT